MRSRHGYELRKAIQPDRILRANMARSMERKVVHDLFVRTSARVGIANEIDERKDEAINKILEKLRQRIR